MKSVIILSIVCVATVYTSERWHIRTRTSSLCFLMRPRSAKSRSGEPGHCLVVPLVAHAGDAISHLQFRRALGMCCILMAASVGSGWYHHFSPAMPRGGLWFAALCLEVVAHEGAFFRLQFWCSKSRRAHRSLTPSSNVCKGCNCGIPPSFCTGFRGE